MMMINRLVKRLEALETTLATPGVPSVHKIIFEDGQGQVHGELLIKHAPVPFRPVKRHRNTYR